MDDETKDMPKSYAISGKIMLSAIIVLFFVVLLMAILHLYARWYILRARRRQNNIRRMRQRQRRTQIVFYGDLTNTEASSNGAGLASAATRGLDASVLNLLPAFVYSSKIHQEPIDCAVCLSEFEENEAGRVLPKCNHTFHIDCIDMWFHSHSTCPLCRSTVEPDESRIQTVIDVDEPGGTELGSSSGVCSGCQYETASEEDNTASSSSASDKSKVSAIVGITVEVPRRNWSTGISVDESGRCESPSTQSSFRSPMSRMLSFKRMLSRERKANSNSPSSPSANVVGCSSVMEPILSDGGGRVETH